MDVVWSGPPQEPESAADAGAGASPYLHAFRRRWLLASSIGVLCAALAGPAVWLSHTPRYTASSLLHVASTQRPILFTTADRGTDFNVYKNTQLQYLRSRFVLIAALRQQPVAKLPTVQAEPDPVAWLAERVQVYFPGEAEVMQVSLSGENREEVAALVNAVVDAYMAEVVDVEQKQRQQRLDDLDRLYTDTESQLRNRRTELRQLVSQLGTGDSQTLTLKQQIMLQQFSAFRSELVSTQFRLMRLNGEFKVKKTAREKADGFVVSDADLEAAAGRDPQTLQLKLEEARLREYVAGATDVAQPTVAARYSSRQQRELEGVRQKLAARRETLRDELRRQRLGQLDEEIRQLDLEVATLAEQQKRLQQDVDRTSKEAEKIGGSSIDVEMQRAEISLLEKLLSNIADEREKLRIELRSKPRITVVQRAEVPQTADRSRKLQLTVFAAMLGLLVPIGGIVWWDSRGQRVNTPLEVSQGIGLNVIGAMPVIPPQAINPKSVARRHEQWRAMFAEAVNGIAARLLRHAEREQMRVILVSSAMGGEGKTTLASHLAMSLAHIGHRTALVDFDLRRPSVDEILDLPLSPGIGEVLRNEAPLEEAVRPTGDPNLFVVTAGRWSRGEIGFLANGATAALFDGLRTRFDFVIVDGSPILPVADTRFICRHADGVVLSILRDVSRVPKILAACEILAAFRVRNLGAVVTGSAGEVYYHDPRYEAAVDV
jgi:capsular exopolysaccharide synthesis family protein